MVSTNAAPPVHGITISSRCSGAEITRDASTSSMVIGCPWKTADGFAHALTRWSAAILARARSSQP